MDRTDYINKVAELVDVEISNSMEMIVEDSEVKEMIVRWINYVEGWMKVEDVRLEGGVGEGMVEEVLELMRSRMNDVDCVE